jgi:allantoate deiminase
MLTKLERIKNNIETLSQYNATPAEGLTRLSFSREHQGAREYIKEEMRKCGLKVYEDNAGTIVGRLDGQLRDAPVVMIGSHYDSVRNGGNFDGPAGVISALEVARTIQENKLSLKHPVEVVAMIEEEGSRFGGGLFASRSMVGKVKRSDLDALKDNQGISIADAMRSFGFDPDKIQEAARKPESVKAFLELHIEQGPVLEHEGLDIGIVDYIVGISQVEITIMGRPDHAGTTPMNMRIDALNAASKVIYELSVAAEEEGEGTVATVGILNVAPGSANIVPGKVKFTVDIRSKNQLCIDNIIRKIEQMLKQASKEKQIGYEILEKLSIAPVRLNEKIQEGFSDICHRLGYSKKLMLSGAGHDAMVMASITDVGLIFVPSKNGRSHCPEEWTDYEYIQKGAELMLKEVLNLAEVVTNEY